MSVAPAPLPGMRRLRVRGIPLGQRRIDVTIEDDRTVDVVGLLDICLDESRPRPPVTRFDL